MARKQQKREYRPGVDSVGRTPLHYAALDGDMTRVKMLLASGEMPDAADDNGWTALHFAAQGWMVEVVRILVDAGANIEARDAHGNTPLFRAVFNSQGRGEVIEMLRSAGADAYAANSHGVSPLSLARQIANFNVRDFFADLPELES